jgi:hypothetical protein
MDKLEIHDIYTDALVSIRYGPQLKMEVVEIVPKNGTALGYVMQQHLILTFPFIFVSLNFVHAAFMGRLRQKMNLNPGHSPRHQITAFGTELRHE